jgi:hypothetical protein
MKPVQFTWNGESMMPAPWQAKLCDQQFVIGERYRMAPVEDRSDTSHRHEFAWLREAWKNLPEKYAELYPSPEHLRKRALIDGGFYTEEVIDAGSNAAALRVAAYVRGHDEFAAVIVRGPAVVVRHAKSQSYRAMDRKEFQESKTAIMEVIAEMIGVSPARMEQEAA